MDEEKEKFEGDSNGKEGRRGGREQALRGVGRVMEGHCQAGDGVRIASKEKMITELHGCDY